MVMTGKDLRKGFAAVVLLVGLGGGWHNARAQADAAKKVVNEQIRAEQAAQQSQRRVDSLDDETTRMLNEYRDLMTQNDSLRGYTKQLDAQVRSQAQELAALDVQISQVENTSREVLPMMARMLETLVSFVRLDMPFLPEERSKRLDNLQAMMDRADVSVAEKYRRLVEAYQIEMEYGRTVEAYEGQLGERTVDFLRLGRVGLMYRTMDGREAGYWDQGQKKWVVADEYAEPMRQALKIARHQAAPDLILAPVPAAKEGAS
jgi:multidrug efflux pump subunit AcrA (membrane-fusion protein)